MFRAWVLAAMMVTCDQRLSRQLHHTVPSASESPKASQAQPALLMQDQSLRTPSLTLRLRSVESEGAANATNGRWTANWRGNPLEIPSDGVPHCSSTPLPFSLCLVTQYAAISGTRVRRSCQWTSRGIILQEQGYGRTTMHHCR